jgi:hypothetical protein
MKMKKLIPLLVLLFLMPVAQGHMPPKDQALIIVRETGEYKFEFLIFPKKPETGVISEIVLNASYMKDEQPYTGGVMMKLREVNVGGNVSPSFDILEAEGDELSPIQYIPGGYEITVVFAANGTYAVEAWPLGNESLRTRVEFNVYPRSGIGMGFFAFFGLLTLILIGVAYAISRSR